MPLLPVLGVRSSVPQMMLFDIAAIYTTNCISPLLPLVYIVLPYRVPDLVYFHQQQFVSLRCFAVSDVPFLTEIEGTRYEYEMNMIFELHDMGVPFAEEQIEVIYLNENESSHFNPIKDSIKIYKVFFKFCLSSFGSASLDLIMFAVFSAIFKSFLPVVSGVGKDAVYAPVCVLFGRWAIDHVAASVVFARILSGIFNYNINRMIFKSKAKDAATSGARYFLIWIVQIGLSAGLVSNIVMLTRLNELFVKIVVDTILFFISYKIQQLWVFKKKQK